MELIFLWQKTNRNKYNSKYGTRAKCYAGKIKRCDREGLELLWVRLLEWTFRGSNI